MNNQKQSENEIYFCKICDKTFSSKGNLNKHIKTVHEGLKYSSRLERKQNEKITKICQIWVKSPCPILNSPRVEYAQV